MEKFIEKPRHIEVQILGEYARRRGDGGVGERVVVVMMVVMCDSGDGG